MLTDLLQLVFPECCVACADSLYKHEKGICTMCLYNLPKTNFHLMENNAIEKIFIGRTKVERAFAYLYFEKGGKVQQLMHALKYENRTEVGDVIGKLYGLDIKQSLKTFTPDIIVPVPLHRKKLRKRGYNQVEYFARGLARSMELPYDPKALHRNHYNSTQTKTDRYNRWLNVVGSFEVNSKALVGKHVLLVDDVITTGATLESCARELLTIEGVRVSICTMAYANIY